MLKQGPESRNRIFRFLSFFIILKEAELKKFILSFEKGGEHEKVRETVFNSGIGFNLVVNYRGRGVLIWIL